MFLLHQQVEEAISNKSLKDAALQILGNKTNKRKWRAKRN
jgi:hypothetical protein